MRRMPTSKLHICSYTNSHMNIGTYILHICRATTTTIYHSCTAYAHIFLSSQTVNEVINVFRLWVVARRIFAVYVWRRGVVRLASNRHHATVSQHDSSKRDRQQAIDTRTQFHDWLKIKIVFEVYIYIICLGRLLRHHSDDGKWVIFAHLQCHNKFHTATQPFTTTQWALLPTLSHAPRVMPIFKTNTIIHLIYIDVRNSQSIFTYSASHLICVFVCTPTEKWSHYRTHWGNLSRLNSIQVCNRIAIWRYDEWPTMARYCRMRQTFFVSSFIRAQ